jgi:hypothetical protein
VLHCQISVKIRYFYFFKKITFSVDVLASELAQVLMILPSYKA